MRGQKKAGGPAFGWPRDRVTRGANFKGEGKRIGTSVLLWTLSFGTKKEPRLMYWGKTREEIKGRRARACGGVFWRGDLRRGGGKCPVTGAEEGAPVAGEFQGTGVQNGPSNACGGGGRRGWVEPPIRTGPKTPRKKWVRWPQTTYAAFTTPRQGNGGSRRK